MLHLFCAMFINLNLDAQELGLLKYQGGGDWYANPTALPQLIGFCNDNIGTDLAETPVTVDLMDEALFDLPWIHMTGHGNVYF